MNKTCNNCLWWKGARDNRNKGDCTDGMRQAHPIAIALGLRRGNISGVDSGKGRAIPMMIGKDGDRTPVGRTVEVMCDKCGGMVLVDGVGDFKCQMCGKDHTVPLVPGDPKDKPYSPYRKIKPVGMFMASGTDAEAWEGDDDGSLNNKGRVSTQEQRL